MTEPYDKICAVVGLVEVNGGGCEFDPPLIPDGERRALRHIWAAEVHPDRRLVSDLGDPKTVLYTLAQSYLLTIDPSSPTAAEQAFAWSTCQRITWAYALAATRTGSSAHIALVAMQGADGVWREPGGWGLPDVDAEAQGMLRELRQKLLSGSLPMLIR